MSDTKPGCIHPGDPEGCLGTFVTLGLLVGLTLIATTWTRRAAA